MSAGSFSRTLPLGKQDVSLAEIAIAQSGGSDRPAPSDQAPHASTREHIAYIGYFRAVAMLMIVTGHTYALAWTHGISQDPTLEPALSNALPALINGGTALFVFISGFLYRQVFYERMPYGEFMRRKALNVGLPYLVIATPIAAALIATGAFEVTVVREGVPYPESGFVDYITLISTGRMVTAYWYIPCAMLLFLASPLFDRFIRMQDVTRWCMLGAAIVLALWIHRPHDNLDPIHSFLYFVNFYLFGILFCEYRGTIMPRLTRNRALIITLAILLAVAAAQALVVGRIDNIERHHNDGWLPVAFDLMLVQKYAAIFALCGLLSRFGHFAGRPLEFIAKYSFGIFFMHGVVLAALIRLPAAMTPHFGNPALDVAAYTALVVTLSVLLIFSVKTVAGRRSRYLIGC